ncbi:MAG: hypothetical protein ABIS01_17075 [Ferruginibacter sp.]
MNDIKTFLSLLIVVVISGILHAHSVGIGTTAPGASALLDVTSSKKGLLPPRMTFTQRNAIEKLAFASQSIFHVSGPHLYQGLYFELKHY